MVNMSILPNLAFLVRRSSSTAFIVGTEWGRRGYDLDAAGIIAAIGLAFEVG